MMGTDRAFEKRSTLLVLAFIALAAYFQAAGAMQLLGARLAAGGPVLARSRGATAATLPGLPDAKSAAILARNPFDSSTGRLGSPLAPAPGSSAPDDNDPLTAPICDSPQLVIVSESGRLNASLATLQIAGEARPHVHRVGDEVAGKRIEWIGFNPRERTPAVWLSSAGRLCQAQLFRDQPGPTVYAAVTETATPVAMGEQLPAELASKIRKLSETEFDVDRALFERVLQNPQQFAPHVRIVPETKDGAVIGVRLFGIRPGSLFALLGLQSGDRLDSINGYSMGDPEKALQAYAYLRTASRLDLALDRRGQPLHLVVHIK